MQIKVMRKYFFVVVISFLSMGYLHSICLPVYPFEIGYYMYSGEKKGDVSSLFHLNTGFRIEKLKFVYFDFSILADVFFNINKEDGARSEMLQKDAREFLNASANFPSIKGLPLSVSLFFGKYDELSSDSILREHVKRSVPNSAFARGYPANVFRPDLAIGGLGLAVYGVAPNGFYSGFYGSWNTKASKDFALTNDFRVGFVYSAFIFESFIGFISKQTVEDSKLRSGVMASVEMEDAQLLLKMGLANIPIQKVLSLKDLASHLYLLVEPGIKRDFFDMALSFFLSSPFQLPKDLEKIGVRGNNFVGLNLLLGFGNLEMYRLHGGISLLTALSLPNVAEITPFTFSIAPFFTFVLSDFEFNLKMPFNPLFYNDLRRSVVFEFSVKALL